MSWCLEVEPWGSIKFRGWHSCERDEWRYWKRPGLPWWLSGWESTSQCREQGLVWADPTCGRASEPARCSPWPCELKSLCSSTREAATVRSACTITQQHRCSPAQTDEIKGARRLPPTFCHVRLQEALCLQLGRGPSRNLVMLPALHLRLPVSRTVESKFLLSISHPDYGSL